MWYWSYYDLSAGLDGLQFVQADINHFQTAGSLIPEQFTLENYANGWRGIGAFTFGKFFCNSFFLVILATIGTLLSSAIVAYGFPVVISNVKASCLPLCL